MVKTCEYSKYCGGCNANFDKIEDELAAKTQSVKDTFSKYKDLVSPCVGQYYPLGYRNKVHLAFGSLKGKTIIGFFEENSTKIVNITECKLYGDWLKTLIAILREFVSRFKIRPYDKDGFGTIRYAHARVLDGSLQLTLVVTTENFAGRDWLYHRLTEEFKSVSLYININRRTDHAVFSDRFKFVKGEKYLNFDFCGLKISLSPGSFLQVNLDIAGKMYKRALELLDINKDTTVIDLYSGIGISSMLFSKNAKNVVSIEEVSTATDNAKMLAKNNGINNVNILTGKCESVIDRVKFDGRVVAFLDPARMGVNTKVLNKLNSVDLDKIVYMSCNPETCSHDIDELVSDNKYIVSGIYPYNMFPFTNHIELLVELKKR